MIRRWFFNIAAGISLLICLLSLAHNLTGGVETMPHGLQIPMFLPSDAAEILVIGPRGAEHWEYTSWDNTWYLMSSGPVMAICFAFVPMLWGLVFTARYLETPRPRGVCLSCGYDLRATPDRCPECGAACEK